MFVIANRFSDQAEKAKNLEAVKRSRFPYWDPWMPRNKAVPENDWNGLFGVPAIFRAQEVFVQRPEKPSQLQQIENPLYRYKIPQDKELRPEARITWKAFNGIMVWKKISTSVSCTLLSIVSLMFAKE